MPLICYYPSLCTNGEDKELDGNKVWTGRWIVLREFRIKYERNRFENAQGRILGPKGATIEWLRTYTGCDLQIFTNDTRFTKQDSKMAIKVIHEDLQHARDTVEFGLRTVGRLMDNTDPRNRTMSEYQMFHSGDFDPETVWLPEHFENFDPLTGQRHNNINVAAQAAAIPNIVMPISGGPNHQNREQPNVGGTIQPSQSGPRMPNNRGPAMPRLQGALMPTISGQMMPTFSGQMMPNNGRPIVPRRQVFRPMTGPIMPNLTGLSCVCYCNVCMSAMINGNGF